MKQIEEAFVKYGFDRIVNIDETFVRTQNLPQKVVARRGQNGVKVIRPKSCNTNEETTFIASVTMDHNDILPLGIVAKGKTSRCEKNIKLVFQVMISLLILSRDVQQHR